MNYTTDTKKGIYVVKNRQKYIGTKNPVFKSLWEQRTFYELDNLAHVARWGYECQQIPYFHPIYKRTSVYYPDLFVTTDIGGVLKNFMIEIKPAKFAVPPPPPKAKNPTPGVIDKYRKAQAAYMINVAKWEAAVAWCRRHKVEWMVMTEESNPFIAGSK